MPMQEYKIINATQLDLDLAELATTYRDTFSISATTPLTFPESFIETIDGIEKRDSYSLKLVDKTITAPAGYYKFDGVFTLPLDYVDTSSLKKNSNDLTFTDNVVTAPAGYYESDAIYNLPNSYIDTANITITTFSDEAVIAAALSTGTQITIPAGYYPQDIVIISSQTQEEPTE